MTLDEEVLEAAKSMRREELSSAESTVLQRMCQAAVYDLLSRLKDEVSIDYVHDNFVRSAAALATALYLETDTGSAESYEFEFWECFEGYETQLKKISVQNTDDESSGESASGQQSAEYTVRSGDTLWAIAARSNLTLSQLIALNPQIKNPNLIYAGDVVRLS